MNSNHDFSKTIDFVATNNEFNDNNKMKNCRVINIIFVKKFLTIDVFVTIDKNVFDLISFNILSQRLLIR